MSSEDTVRYSVLNDPEINVRRREVRDAIRFAAKSADVIVPNRTREKLVREAIGNMDHGDDRPLDEVAASVVEKFRKAFAGWTFLES